MVLPESANALEAERIGEKIDTYGLRWTWGHFDEYKARIALHCLLLGLERLALELSFLRHDIVSTLLNLKPDVSTLNHRSIFGMEHLPHQITLGDMLFCYDPYLWKQARKSFTSLLTLGLAFQDIKLRILELFEDYFEGLLPTLEDDKEMGGISIIHFAVQILTVPSIARQACLNKLPHKICNALEEMFHEKHNLPEDKTSPIHVISPIVNMLRFISCDESVAKDRLLIKDEAFLESLAQALFSLQGKFLIFRSDTEYVYYEDTDRINETIRVTITLLSWLADFVQTFQSIDDLTQALYILSACFQRQPASNNSEEQFCFMMPFYWLIGMIIRRIYLLQGSKFQPVMVSKKLASEAALVLSTYADMRLRLWVRNGIEVASQVHHESITISFM